MVLFLLILTLWVLPAYVLSHFVIFFLWPLVSFALCSCFPEIIPVLDFLKLWYFYYNFCLLFDSLFLVAFFYLSFVFFLLSFFCILCSPHFVSFWLVLLFQWGGFPFGSSLWWRLLMVKVKAGWYSPWGCVCKWTFLAFVSFQVTDLGPHYREYLLTLPHWLAILFE